MMYNQTLLITRDGSETHVNIRCKRDLSRLTTCVNSVWVSNMWGDLRPVVWCATFPAAPLLPWEDPGTAFHLTMWPSVSPGISFQQTDWSVTKRPKSSQNASCAHPSDLKTQGQYRADVFIHQICTCKVQRKAADLQSFKNLTLRAFDADKCFLMTHPTFRQRKC